MKKQILFLIFLFYSVDCQAGEFFTPLTEQQLQYEIVFVGLTLIDWDKTKKFTALGVPEANPFLGRYPSQQRIDTLIGSALIGHVLFNWFLPSKYRDFFQPFTIGIEAHAVMINITLGY